MRSALAKVKRRSTAGRRVLRDARAGVTVAGHGDARGERRLRARPPPRTPSRPSCSLASRPPRRPGSCVGDRTQWAAHRFPVRPWSPWLSATVSSTSCCSAPPGSPAPSPPSTSPATRPTGCAGRWPAATPSKLERVRGRLAEIDPALADLELLHRRRDDPASLADVAGRGQGRGHDRRPLPEVRRAAGGGRARSRHRLRRPHRGAGVRRPDVRRPPRDRRSAPARASCTPAASTRSRTTSAPTSRSSSCPTTGRSRSAAWSASAQAVRRHLPLRRRPRCRGPGRRGRPRRPDGGSSRARRAARPEPSGGKPRRDPVLGYWLLPLPTIDPIIVARSGAARCRRTARSSATRTSPAPRPCATPRAAPPSMAGLGLAAQVGPLRNLLLERLQPGDGPDEARRAKSWFRVDFVGEAGGADGAHAGLRRRPRLRRDRQDAGRVGAVPRPRRQPRRRPGQVTTAQAMGEHLTARLQKAGMSFETLG